MRAAQCRGVVRVELLPRYCIDTKGLSTEVELFGRRYAAPFGVAPMGSGGLMWPGAEEYLAREAQRRNIPYILATPANASIERIAEIAPDVFWFQLYRFAANDHAITFDLVRRADAAGAQVLVPTIDSAGKSKRPRDIRNGVKVPFTDRPEYRLPGRDLAVLGLGAVSHRHAALGERRAVYARSRRRAIRPPR